MEQRAMLVGYELVEFENDKKEQVSFTRLHLLEPEDVQDSSGRIFGRRVSVKNTTKIIENLRGMVGYEVRLLYELPFGGKTPRFCGIGSIEE